MIWYRLHFRLQPSTASLTSRSDCEWSDAILTSFRPSKLPWTKCAAGSKTSPRSSEINPLIWRSSSYVSRYHPFITFFFFFLKEAYSCINIGHLLLEHNQLSHCSLFITILSIHYSFIYFSIKLLFIRIVLIHYLFTISSIHYSLIWSLINYLFILASNYYSIKLY